MIDTLFRSRDPKPRASGLLCVIDTGAPADLFADVIRSHHELIDFVKFGWCTALLQPRLHEKLAVLRAFDVDFHFGGTLYEKVVLEGRLDDYLCLLRRLECRHVEVSDGTIALPASEKLAHISRLAEEFTVLAEVGSKSTVISDSMTADEWVLELRDVLGAGATYAIVETRESGSAGLCRSDGSIRDDVLAAILADWPTAEPVIFEAPNRALQTAMIHHLGRGVNLANIALLDVVGAETLRLGLRSDTLLGLPRAKVA